MSSRPISVGFFFLLVLAESLAAAQSPDTCMPSCRRGYICIEGTCVSPCNPPCDAGDICTAEGECLSPASVTPVVPPAASPSVAPTYATPTSFAPSPRERPPAPPWDPSSVARTRLELGFRLAAAGKLKVREGRFGDELSLDPTIGATARLLLPLSEYLSLGPAVAFGAWRPSSEGGFEFEREFYFDLGGSVRGGYPFPLGTAGHGSAYGALSTGYSFLSAADENLDTEFAHGFHVGLVGGVQLTFGERFGTFVELGWLGHQTWSSGARITMNQLLLQLGFAISLGT
jgi:hypothetical protein